MNYVRHDPDTVYAFIAGYIRQHGSAPSLREIGIACGISSTSVVRYSVNGLVASGRLVRGDRYKSRTLTLPEMISPCASLEEQARVWNELGAVLVWKQDATGQYSSFEAWQNRDGRYVRLG